MGNSAAFQIGGVACSIAMEGDGGKGVVEQYAPEPSAEVVFKVPYASRNTVVLNLLGGVVASGWQISRVPPLQYPPNPNLVCLSIGATTGIKPRTNHLGWVEYEYVLMPAHFGVPEWDSYTGVTNPDLSGHRYTVTKFKNSSEIFAPPIGSFYYRGSDTYTGSPVAEASVGIVRSRSEIQFTRKLMPFVPVTDLMDTVGSVNSDAITLGDFEFPAGCLLFTGWDLEPRSDAASGVRVWDIVFNLLGNENITWNEFMNPGGHWVPINSKSDGSGDPPFASVAFSDLLFGDDFS